MNPIRSKAKLVRPRVAPAAAKAAEPARVANGDILNFLSVEIIVGQGEPTDSLLYVHAGRVKVGVQSEAGREALISMLGPGDFFGYGCLVGKEQRIATAAAMTACVVERITPPVAIAALDRDPQFSRIFRTALLRRTIQFQEDLVDRHFNSSEKRLARILMRLAGSDGNLIEMTDIGTNQSILAEMVGTTRSRVNFFINKFRRMGHIDYNGKLVVRRSLSQVLR